MKDFSETEEYKTINQEEKEWLISENRDKTKLILEYNKEISELKNQLIEKDKQIEELKQSCQNWFEHCRENKQSELLALSKVAEYEAQIETKDIQIKESQEQKCYWKESSFDWRHKFFKKGRIKQLIKKEKRIKELEKEIKLLGERCNQLLTDKGKLTDENAELKARIGTSIDCEKAQKNGELCLGYADDEDEPCERCKNCIKCECGYYQLGETEKDEQLIKAKELIKTFLAIVNNDVEYVQNPQECKDLWKELCERAEQFIKDSEVEK